MPIRRDYSIDVLRLLESLKQQIEAKKTLGRSVVFGLDKDDLVMQIEQVRASMPRELKDAASLTRETERIMTTAEEEARALMDTTNAKVEAMLAEATAKVENMIQQAQLKQNEMVDENEILRIAKAQAEEIRRAAEKDSREMRRGADHYALDVLENVENVVARVLSTVEKGKRELVTQDSPTTAVVETQREKVKV